MSSRTRQPDPGRRGAKVFQSLLGPTEVAIVHRETEVVRFTGFVALTPRRRPARAGQRRMRCPRAAWMRE